MAEKEDERVEEDKKEKEAEENKRNGLTVRRAESYYGDMKCIDNEKDSAVGGC